MRIILLLQLVGFLRIAANRGLYALLLEEGTKITYSPEKFTQESLNEFLKEIPFSKQTYGIDPCIIDYITLIKKKTKKGGL